jgi:type II secretory pathway component PulL
VRVTIADEAVVTRVLEVPAMPRRDLTRAAAFLALKEVPIPIDKAAWAWDVVASADTANGVCLVACWRDVVERLQAALVSAHLRPEVVEPRSFALARALDMDSGIVLEAVGGAVRATVVAPGAPPYVEQVPLPLSGAERSQVITGLQRRVIAQHAAAAGADLRPQTVLAGELQPDSIPGLQGMAASQVLNGHKPRRPADLPVGFFLPAIGLAMRGRR